MMNFNFAPLENPPRILLVEDNVIVLRLIEKIVSQAGCHYTSATNGEHALELAKTKVFDMIITDLGLPGISGAVLATHIREWEKSFNKKQIPIVGLSANAIKDSETKCKGAGFNKILKKPIYLDEMQELVFQFI